MSVDLEDLDSKTQDVLLALYDEGGEQTSSDLAELVGVSSTNQVKYRIREHLIPAGLVEEEADRRDESGRSIPNLYWLTPEGREYADLREKDLRDQSGLSVEERVDRLERLTDRLREELVQVKFSQTPGDTDE